jgi:hypothetical protein
LIKAKADAELQEIRMRMNERLEKQEVRRQRNIESIATKAAHALPPPDREQEVSDKPVNEDWTTRFFQECQDISDEQMQQLWARILAGEVTKPGSFAPRT